MALHVAGVKSINTQKKYMASIRKSKRVEPTKTHKYEINYHAHGGGIFALAFLFVSCQKTLMHNELTVDDTISLNPKGIETGLHLEQISIITGEVFRDKKLQQEFQNLVIRVASNYEQEDEAIYFKQIINGNIYGVGQDFCMNFKKRYLQIFNEGKYFKAEKFKTITEKIKSKWSNTRSTSNGSSLSSIQRPGPYHEGPNNGQYEEMFLTDEGTQIYFPYSENFPNSTETPAIASDPGYDVDEATAYIYSGNNPPRPLLVNEDYAELHPLYVINLGPLGENGEIILLGDPLMDLPPIPIPGDPTTTPPPPILQGCFTLNYNTHNDAVDDRYIVSNTIPKIMLTQDFRSFLGGGNYLKLHQVYAIPVNLSVDADKGSLAVGTNPNREVFTTSKIKRKYKNQWRPFGQVWSGDWKMIQHDHAMAYAYQGGFLAGGDPKIKYKIGAGIKYDAEKKKWVPSFDASVSLECEFSLKGKWFLAHGTDVISRRDMLAHVVGNNFGLGTALEAGETTAWTIRKSGSIKYYFKNAICY